MRQLQRRLWSAAKRHPGRRFHALHDRTVCSPSGLSRLGSFPTDPTGAHQTAYENAVRVACRELYEALELPVRIAE